MCDLENVLVAMEKENLVFDSNFKPVNFKEENLGDNLTLDFADHQIEIVSNPHESVSKLKSEMYQILDRDLLTNNNIWPLSQPGKRTYDVQYQGTKTKKQRDYREGLAAKYDLNLMLVCGIHFNYGCTNESFESKEKMNEHYFELMKKVYEYGPLLLQFVGFTPVYERGILTKGIPENGKNNGYENAISLRNSQKHGYYNEHKLDLDYTNIETYRNSVAKSIANKEISSNKELYSKVRLKDGYIELRFIDLNPYSRLGIADSELELLLLGLEVIKKKTVKNFDIKNALDNFERVSLDGLNNEMKMMINGKTQTIKEHTNDFINVIKQIKYISKEQVEVLDRVLERYNTAQLDVNKMIDEIKKDDLTVDEFGKRHAFKRKQFDTLYPDLKMELSTKILMQEAEKSNYKINVLDEVNNVIKISDENSSQLVVQATKTNKDAYANILMMENKHMTKEILNENNIKVPQGTLLKKNYPIDYSIFKKSMVVKPVDTNFGMGITILEKNPTKEQVDKAISFAFDNSDLVIIEEFFEGTELRFLVINDELVSIVKREPAHVIGDGIHTISELIEIKNQNPLRSKGYVTPVELLNLGEFETEFLKEHGYNPSDVLEKNQKVNLRKNSNVSTGGDSFEVLEQIPMRFKKIAEKAAKALDVKICGVDMIIDDQFDPKSDYTIIEANFNPAIQMHTYPFVGYGKNVAKNILDLLFEK